VTVKRKLTTIFCADVVGYSRLMGADEHGTLKRLKGCREFMAAFIERHHGRVVSWSGDAVLADFSSVVESVQCAIEVQRELKARNADVPKNDRMEFRIGVNLGDVMIDEHDIFGEGVNIASRLQGLAPPGGILISGSVFEQVKNRLTVRYNFMGNQQVKNIADQVAAYVVMHEVQDLTPHESAKAKPSGAVRIGATGSNGATAPLELFIRRAIAAGVDAIVATAAILAIALPLETQGIRAMDFDFAFRAAASDRTIKTFDPATEIRDGGNVIVTSTTRLIERKIFRTVRRTYRVTAMETTTMAPATGASTRRTSQSSEIREDLIDAKTGKAIFLPSATMLTVLVYFLMSALFEAGGGSHASPGKRLLGLSVRSVSGGDLGLLRAAGRNAAKILSAAVLGLGFLMPLWSKRRQSLHDLLLGAAIERR
jgi:class 3 adenylate cyclase